MAFPPKPKLNDLLLGQVQLDVGCELYGLTDDEATGLEFVVPLQVVVEAVDGTGKLEAGLGEFFGLDGTEVGHRERNILGHIEQGQLAHSAVGFAFLHEFAGELDLREFLSVEEIGALQVAVTHFILGVDGSHLCNELDGCTIEVLSGGGHLDIRILEGTGNFGDHHVGHSESDVGVRLVKCPVGLCNRCGGADSGQQQEKKGLFHVVFLVVMSSNAKLKYMLQHINQ